MAGTAAELTSESPAAPAAGIPRAGNKSPVTFPVAGLKSFISRHTACWEAAAKATTLYACPR
jgi:hypothetical protein